MKLENAFQQLVQDTQGLRLTIPDHVALQNVLSRFRDAAFDVNPEPPVPVEAPSEPAKTGPAIPTA